MKPTLIVQIGEKNNPIPMLLGEESLLEKKNNPLLQVLTYTEGLKPEEARETALNILENEPLKERGIFYKELKWEQEFLNNSRKLQESAKVIPRELDSYSSISKIYLPWKKGEIRFDLAKKAGALYGEVIGMYGLTLASIGFPFLGLGVGSASLLVFALVEKDRRNKKEIARTNLNKLENVVDSYKNLEDNLKRAEIKIYSPKPAKEIFEKVKEIRKRKNNPYELKSINLKKVNKDLIDLYDNFLRANP